MSRAQFLFVKEKSALPEGTQEPFEKAKESHTTRPSCGCGPGCLEGNGESFRPVRATGVFPGPGAGAKGPRDPVPLRSAGKARPAASGTGVPPLMTGTETRFRVDRQTDLRAPDCPCPSGGTCAPGVLLSRSGVRGK